MGDEVVSKGIIVQSSMIKSGEQIKKEYPPVPPVIVEVVPDEEDDEDDDNDEKTSKFVLNFKETGILHANETNLYLYSHDGKLMNSIDTDKEIAYGSIVGETSCVIATCL